MKRVVGISLGSSKQDFHFDAEFMGQELNVRRLGTDGSTAKAVRLLRYWEPSADAIGLGVVKDSYTLGSRRRPPGPHLNEQPFRRADHHPVSRCRSASAHSLQTFCRGGRGDQRLEKRHLRPSRRECPQGQ